MNTNIAVFGGGCFWCTEAVFSMVKGVKSVVPGYAGGQMPDPNYEAVSTGKTGHAEVVKIEFDPSVVGYHDLLIVFFATHDPTTLNRQGNDVGTQYRSLILYTSEDQRREAEDFIKELDNDGSKRDIVTEVKPLDKFYEAEDYHKEYYQHNTAKPYCQLVINPKLEKLQKALPGLLKK